jgi:hypothetical protein
MIWGIGLCAVLILTGAALAVAFSRHDPQANNQSDSYPQKPLISDSQNSSGSSRANETGSVRSPNQAGTIASTGAGFGSSAYMPQYGIPYSPPPVIVYQTPPSSRQSAPIAKNSSPVSSPARPAKPVGSVEREPSISDDNAARIRLRVDESDSGNEGHPIPVPNAPNDQSNQKPSANQGPETPPRINVRPSPGAPDVSASFAPTAEAAALIAVAEDKLRKMDYAGAILAFGKALAGANDESAYVYQQMGECYRYRNENKNATSCYTRGRDEYRKLITAGRQLERANSGLRICENGIKICGSE